MRIKTVLLGILWITTFYSVRGQDQMFLEAFQEFSTSRLWELEEIPIDWKIEGTLQADLNEGLNGLLEGNPQLAEGSLTIVIKKDSTVWQAYYYRAVARKQLKKLGIAENDIRRALHLHHDFYEGNVEFAKILYLRGQLYESERAINKAIRLNKSKGTAYYLKGDINMEQNELYSAINNYKDCLAVDSLFHNARIKLALLDLMSKKDLSSAISHLNKVLSYDSLQKTALLFRSILMHDKDKKQSVKDLSNLILTSPNNVMARFYRGLFSAELEDYVQAFNDFQKIIKATSTSDNNFVGQQTLLDKKIDLQNAGSYTLTRVYGLPEDDGLKIKQAYCNILTGDYDKSIAILDQTSNRNREPLAVYLKAVAYEHKGVHVKAFQLYSIALVLDNEITDAHKKRGIYEQEIKEWDKSIDDFNAVLRLTPDAYIINRARGVSYYQTNRFNEAISDFSVYIMNDSANKEVRGYRGMAYMKNNQRLKAYVDFATSDNHNMLNFQDMEKLIDSVLQRKDTVQALYNLNIITKSAPYFTEGYVQKFRIHMARKEWNLVEADIAKALHNSRQNAPKPKHSYLLTLQALVYSKSSHTDDAVKTLNEAIKFDEKNDIAYLERGRLFMAMGKTSKAENDFKMATSLGNEQAKQILSNLVK